MTLLFLYWFKYIYVEKDDDYNRSQYRPIPNKYEDKDNKKQTLYQVDPNFLKKKRSKKD